MAGATFNLRLRDGCTDVKIVPAEGTQRTTVEVYVYSRLRARFPLTRVEAQAVSLAIQVMDQLNRQRRPARDVPLDMSTPDEGRIEGLPVNEDPLGHGPVAALRITDPSDRSVAIFVDEWNLENLAQWAEETASWLRTQAAEGKDDDAEL